MTWMGLNLGLWTLCVTQVTKLALNFEFSFRPLRTQFLGFRNSKPVDFQLSSQLRAPRTCQIPSGHQVEEVRPLKTFRVITSRISISDRVQRSPSLSEFMVSSTTQIQHPSAESGTRFKTAVCEGLAKRRKQILFYFIFVNKINSINI